MGSGEAEESTVVKKQQISQSPGLIESKYHMDLENPWIKVLETPNPTRCEPGDP